MFVVARPQSAHQSPWLAAHEPWMQASTGRASRLGRPTTRRLQERTLSKSQICDAWPSGWPPIPSLQPPILVRAFISAGHLLCLQGKLSELRTASLDLSSQCLGLAFDRGRLSPQLGEIDLHVVFVLQQTVAPIVQLLLLPEETRHLTRTVWALCSGVRLAPSSPGGASATSSSSSGISAGSRGTSTPLLRSSSAVAFIWAKSGRVSDARGTRRHLTIYHMPCNHHPLGRGGGGCASAPGCWPPAAAASASRAAWDAALRASHLPLAPFQTTSGRTSPQEQQVYPMRCRYSHPEQPMQTV